MIDRSLLQRAARGLALAARFTSLCVGGVVLGIWMDRTLGSTPWLLLCFSFAGMGLATWQILRTLHTPTPDDPP